MVTVFQSFHNNRKGTTVDNPDTGIDISYTNGPTLHVDMTAVLRPFESKLYQTTRGRQQQEEVPVEEAVFTLTASAKVEVTTLAAMGWSVSWPDPDPDNPDSEEDEISRVTRTKRVFNPSDSEQYVDVEIIDSVVFKDSNNRSIRVNLNND